VTQDFNQCVRELSIEELAESMEVEGKGKEKLVAANDSFDADDANEDLEKFEGYNSEAEAAELSPDFVVVLRA